MYEKARLMHFPVLAAVVLGGRFFCFGVEHAEPTLLKINGPLDLVDELHWAQTLAVFDTAPVTYQAGFFLFEPDGSDPYAERFLEGLRSDLACQSGTNLIAVQENALTETLIFRNGEGHDVIRIPSRLPHDGFLPDDALYYKHTLTATQPPGIYTLPNVKLEAYIISPQAEQQTEFTDLLGASATDEPPDGKTNRTDARGARSESSAVHVSGLDGIGDLPENTLQTAVRVASPHALTLRIAFPNSSDRKVWIP